MVKIAGEKDENGNPISTGKVSWVDENGEHHESTALNALGAKWTGTSRSCKYT